VSNAPIDVEAARRQLQRILASPGLVRNERMSRFLRFLVERHLEGSDNQLKESVIAVEVFGRKPDHDPSRDSIVRTEAGRLRARLAEYYLRKEKTMKSSSTCPRADTRRPFVCGPCRHSRR
jgi:hypothetical protein